MINISKSMRDLFNSSEQKYFFIYYTTKNGSGWLTNENIKINSLELQEQLCSEEILKFGLCNANSFAFDCTLAIGIGQQIKVYVGDSSTNISNVLSRGLSLGEYTVQDCKKTQGSLYHISAYGKTADSVTSSAARFEAWKLSQATYYATYYNQDRDVLYTELGFITRTPERLASEVYSNPKTMMLIEGTPEGRLLELEYIEINLDEFFPTTYRDFYTKEDYVRMLIAVMGGYVSNVSYILERWYEQYSQYWKQEELTAALIGTGLKPIVRHVDKKYDESSSLVWHKNNFFAIDPNVYFYPYGGSPKGGTSYTLYDYSLFIPTSIVGYRNETRQFIFDIYEGGSPYVNWAMYPNGEKIRIYKTKEVNNNDAGRSFYYATSKLDCDKVLNSYYEINGYFGFQDRNGNLTTKRLSHKTGAPLICGVPGNEASPESLVGGHTTIYANNIIDYEILAEPTEEYSYVRVKYRNRDNNVVTRTLQISRDSENEDITENVYDMTENTLLNTYNYTDKQVEDIIYNNFQQHIKSLSYTPCNLELKGIPYFEVGDRVTFVDKDGVNHETIILSRTLKGDQFMVDNYSNIGFVVDPNSEEYLNNKLIVESED